MDDDADDEGLTGDEGCAHPTTNTVPTTATTAASEEGTGIGKLLR
jgi:hypothetical protein